MEPPNIPFQPGFLLGCPFDIYSWSGIQGIAGTDECSRIEQINTLSTAFAVAPSLDVLCDALGIHPEYALKVANTLISNDMVSACLKCLEDKHTLAMVIRTTFIQQRQTASARAKVMNIDAGTPSAHWVKALDVGTELVILVKFLSEDIDLLNEVHECMAEDFPCQQGHLNLEMIETLQDFAKQWDKNLTKRGYKDLKLSIDYFSHLNDGIYPADLKGMMNTLRLSLNCYANLALKQRTETDYDIHAKSIKCYEGKVRITSQVESLSDKVARLLSGQDCPKSDMTVHTSKENLFYLKAALTSDTQGKGVSPIGSPGPNPEFKENDYDRIFTHSLAAMKAKTEIQNALTTICLDCKELTEQAECILESANQTLDIIWTSIRSLDMVTPPSPEVLKVIVETDMLNKVETFMKKATKVPGGSDLDFLIIGKTGNGKSSTANSILNQHKFKTSSGSMSETIISGMSWSSIDGRTIKVVDTPGVFDTRLGTNDTGIEIVINALSKAIVKCNTGFHALLVVVRFGTRMTKEEIMSIELLKRVLGEDIIKTHSICVFTHGDDFVKETKGKRKQSFIDRCKQEKGYLGTLLKECNYRCVLFDNNTSEAIVRKSQLVRLVYLADQLCIDGVRYTSKIFELASEMRQQAILDQDSPEAAEGFLKDFQVVMSQLDRMKEGINIDDDNDPDIIVLKLRLEAFKVSIMETNSECPVLNSTDEIMKKLEDKTCTKEDLNTFNEDLQTYYSEEVEKKTEKVEEQVTEAVQEVVVKRKCFPGSSKVTLRDGRTKMMQDLAVGDQVLVRKGNGELGLDTVYMFGHSDFESRAEFLIIKTTSTSVSVTEGHCVYCFKEGVEVCIPARQIVRGDKMLVTDGGQLLLETVCEIKRETKQGMFAPFTYSGTIIVDGSLMSCYVDVLDPRVSHVLLWPIRKLYSVSPRTLAWLNGTGKQNVMPPWAKMALKWM